MSISIRCIWSATLIAATGLVSPVRAQRQTVPLAPVRLVNPPALDSAIARRTRTAAGAPGARYWQNGADYDIAVRITPEDSLLVGRESVVYHNRSPDTLRAVVFHVYQNLMGAFGARELPVAWTTSGMHIDALVADGVPVRIAPGIATLARRDTSGTEASIYGTLMRVPLATPLSSGDSARFVVRWHFRIPPATARRMRMVDTTTAQVAQWYPQIAVYDDLRGWDTEQYTGTGEFYLDYGRFRYAVTLPAGYVVGGTGTLENARAVLTDAERAALGRATPNAIVHVLSARDFGAGRATAGTAGSELTWRFAADSVRDVAFSYGNHYCWDATRAVVDSATRRTALVNVLYRPDAPGFSAVAAMARAALETHSSRMVPYPYLQLTESEGGSGGMEYPMTVFVEGYAGVPRMQEVTAHEIGHEWFPMLVGSDETLYGWQDEGLNTFDTFFASRAYLPDSLYAAVSVAAAQRAYERFASRTGERFPMMAPPNAFGIIPGSGYGIEAYAKPAVTLWALRAILGDATFTRAYRAYIHRWAYRHPTPWDFFHTFDDVTGQNLDAFFQQWFFTNERLDQALVRVTQQGGRVTVTVDNRGGLYAPVDLTATTAGGRTTSWRVPMSVWYGGSTRVTTTHTVPGRVTRVEIDAAHDFPEVGAAGSQIVR